MLPTETLFQIFGGISLLCSGAIVLTGLVFPSMMFNPKRVFSHILFVLSFCDMIGSIGYCLGFPRYRTMKCTVQGVLLSFFPPASWIWTLMLVFQLRCVVLKHQVWLKVSSMHLICWTVTIIVACIPLSSINDTYSFDDEFTLSGRVVCFYRMSMPKLGYWLLFWYFGFGFIYLMILLIFMTQVGMNLVSTISYRRADVLKLFYAMGLYPLAMFICGAPICIDASVWAAHPSVFDVHTYNVCVIIGTQYGALMGVIFFTMTAEPYQLWSRLCARWCRRCIPEQRQPTSTGNLVDAAANGNYEEDWFVEVTTTKSTLSYNHHVHNEVFGMGAMGTVAVPAVNPSNSGL